LNATQVGFVVAVLLSATASAAVGIIALGRARKLDVLPWLAVMALAQAIWSLFYACKLVAPTLEIKVLWDKAEWVPVMVAINAMWGFSLAFAGGRAPALRIGRPVNFVLGVVFLALVAGDTGSGLGYRHVELRAEPFPALHYDFGPAALAMILWLYILAGWGLLALYRRRNATHPLYRRQLTLVLVGNAFPIFGELFYVFGFAWDVSPFAFALSDVIIAVALLRGGLLETVPIARELVFEHIGDGVVVEDTAGRVVDLNPAAARLLGEPARGAAGGELAALAGKLGVTLPPASGDARWEVAGDAGRRQIQVTSTAIVGPSGTAGGRLLLLRDDTAMMRALAEVERYAEELAVANRSLERANRELESFNSSVSHDLLAPLRHMRSFATLLAAECGDKLSPQGQHLLATIERAGERMSSLVEGLLRLGRAGQQPLKIEPVALDELAAEILDADRGRVAQTRVARGLAVEADRVLAYSLMQNLIGNALKFSRGRGADALVEVGRGPTERGDAFFVRDNGVGFDMKYAHQLFKLFHRLHTDAEFEGTGVGLSVVKRIVERHGGQVWLRSAVGAGTTVYFTLP